VRYLLDGGESVALNLGTGHGTTVRELLSAIRRVTGRHVPVEYGERRDGDSPALVADNRRARELLGWAPSRDLAAIVGTLARTPRLRQRISPGLLTTKESYDGTDEPLPGKKPCARPRDRLRPHAAAASAAIRAEMERGAQRTARPKVTANAAFSVLALEEDGGKAHLADRLAGQPDRFRDRPRAADRAVLARQCGWMSDELVTAETAVVTADHKK
jgi:hypothetical protein